MSLWALSYRAPASEIESLDMTSSTSLSSDALIYLRAAAADRKAWITWFDNLGNPTAGVVTHDESATGTLHKHFSIETADSAGGLQTRLEVTYGTDKAIIGTKDADFNIGAGNHLIVGSEAGLDSNADLYNGHLYKWGTGDVGFGDKDWALNGLEVGAKWEFYRETTDATLLVHQNDGTGDADIQLRSGTLDWFLRNNGTSFEITRGTAFKAGSDDAGNWTFDGGLTSDGDFFVGPSTAGFGVGDKDWATAGVKAGAKWEFYRATSTSTLLIHQDDGSSNAELWLRSGSKDYEIHNNGTLLEFVSGTSVIGSANDAGDWTFSGSVTAQLAINEQTASYTLALADSGQYVRTNVATANNVTVPANATVAFPVGSQMTIRQAGAGQTTLVAATGVTINTPETLKIRGQHSAVTLVKVATDTWDLMGDLEAAA